MSFKDLIGFFLATVLAKYVVAPMLGTWIRKWLIRSEGDLIAYMHYKHKAQHKGHYVKHPLDCQDGRCNEV